jgi:hypothetical protein
VLCVIVLGSRYRLGTLPRVAAAKMDLSVFAVCWLGTLFSVIEKDSHPCHCLSCFGAFFGVDVKDDPALFFSQLEKRYVLDAGTWSDPREVWDRDTAGEREAVRIVAVPFQSFKSGPWLAATEPSLGLGRCRVDSSFPAHPSRPSQARQRQSRPQRVQTPACRCGPYLASLRGHRGV